MYNNCTVDSTDKKNYKKIHAKIRAQQTHFFQNENFNLFASCCSILGSTAIIMNDNMAV